MKRLFTLIIFLSPYLVIGQADNYKRIAKIKKIGPAPYTNKYVAPVLPDDLNMIARGVGGASTLYFGTTVGDTYYDLQNNGAGNTGITQYDDGSIALVWTTNSNSTNPVSDGRGAGYAVSDASQSSWTIENTTVDGPPSVNGIFDTRVGWPAIGNSRNGEYVLAHGNDPTQMTFTTRATKGTGTWAANATYTYPITTTEYLWPRMAVKGDTIHMVGSCNDRGNANGGCPPSISGGLDNMMWYSRSTDGGATLDITLLELPGCDTNNFEPVTYSNGTFAALSDAYNIDVNGDVVGIVAGGGPDGMHAWKSTDAGATWTLLPIQFNSDTDTTGGAGFVDDNGGDPEIRMFSATDPNIVVDDNGGIHIVGGTIENVYNEGTGAWGGRAPSPGVSYWNETMLGSRPMVINDALPDINCDSVLDYLLSDDNTGSYGADSGPIQSATISEDGNTVIITFSNVVEGIFDLTRSDTSHIRDLYMMVSQDGGSTWGGLINIAGQLAGYADGIDSTDKWVGSRFAEEVYGNALKHVGADGKFHMMFQSDDFAGTNIGGAPDPPFQPFPSLNTIGYVSYDVSTIIAKSDNESWNDDDCLANYVSSLGRDIDLISNISLFPNPTSGQLNVEFDIVSSEVVTIDVVNILGQKVIQSTVINGNVGANRRTIDVTGLDQGVYFIRIGKDSDMATRKFVRE